MVVGDVNQNLYRWAGGDVDLFREFFKMSGFEYKKLTRNFRCHPNINEYANNCITNQNITNSNCKEVILVENFSKIINEIDEVRVFRRENKICQIMANDYGLIYKKRPYSKYFTYEIEEFLYEYFNGKNYIKLLDNLNIDLNYKSKKIITEAFKNIQGINSNLIKLLMGDIDNSEEYSLYLSKAINDEEVKGYYISNKKSISTIHLAKGLEYEQVVIFEDDYNLASSDQRSLFYVACTRAKEKLYIIKR